MNEHKDVQQKLAGSLTAETPLLLPYLPYLLQDIWELGSIPQDIVDLLEQAALPNEATRLLDLGCGKGAVSITLCQAFGLQATGIDLLPEFIAEAKSKAVAYGVQQLCEFTVEDVNEVVKAAAHYDIAVLSAIGDALGTPQETLDKVKNVIHKEGLLVLDEAYLAGQAENVGYQNYDYLTLPQWEALFQEAGFQILAAAPYENSPQLTKINEDNNRLIRQRAQELTAKYPDKAALFAGYVKSQEMESDDLEGVIVGVTWLLQRFS